MKRSSLIIWALTGIVVIATVTLLILLLVPLVAGLGSVVSQARDAEVSLARLETLAVGDDFERDLRIFAARRIEKAADVEVTRAKLAGRFDAPFPDMKIQPGESRPASDEFLRAYNFNGDQLKSRVRDFVQRAGGPAIREIALVVPPFSSGSQIDAATMRRWQRFANIEARALETAAKLGGAPTSAVRLEEEPPPPDDSDAGYERLRIGIDLLCPEGRVSPVVHSLLACFDEWGGITRLVGLSEAPIPEGRLREQGDAPTKRVSVTLSLGFATPTEETP
jgi:hypothetical protein